MHSFYLAIDILVLKYEALIDHSVMLEGFCLLGGLAPSLMSRYPKHDLASEKQDLLWQFIVKATKQQ